MGSRVLDVWKVHTKLGTVVVVPNSLDVWGLHLIAPADADHTVDIDVTADKGQKTEFDGQSMCQSSNSRRFHPFSLCTSRD